MLIVALYMNEVPNAQWTFLLGWKPDHRAISCHTVHSQSNSMLLYFGFPRHLVKGHIYVHVRQFLQVSEALSFCRVPPCFPPPRSQSSVPWERGCGISGSPDFGDLSKTGRACFLNPSPGVPSRLVSLESTNYPVQCYYLPCYLHLFLDKPAYVPCPLTTRSWRA